MLSSLFSTSSCTAEMRDDDDEVELSSLLFFRVGQTRVTEKYILYIRLCVERREAAAMHEKMIALNGESKREREDDDDGGDGREKGGIVQSVWVERRRMRDVVTTKKEMKNINLLAFLSHKFLRPICSADCGSFTS